MVLVSGQEDNTLLIFVIFISALLLYAQVKELDSKVKKRKESILIELPEFTNKFI